MTDVKQVKKAVISKCKELEQGTASVAVSVREVDRIVVAALLTKYKYFIANNNQELIESFGAVLKFYLSEDELSEYVKAIPEANKLI